MVAQHDSKQCKKITIKKKQKKKSKGCVTPETDSTRVSDCVLFNDRVESSE